MMLDIFVKELSRKLPDFVDEFLFLALQFISFPVNTFLKFKCGGSMSHTRWTEELLPLGIKSFSRLPISIDSFLQLSFLTDDFPC